MEHLIFFFEFFLKKILNLNKQHKKKLYFLFPFTFDNFSPDLFISGNSFGNEFYLFFNSIFCLKIFPSFFSILIGSNFLLLFLYLSSFFFIYSIIFATNININIAFFSFFFSCLLILVLFLFGIFIVCFAFVLKIIDRFLYVSIPGIVFFSSDFLVLENEDLWISANFFYFDNKIMESERLSLPLRNNEFQVFYTLLQLFHKFPQPVFDNLYISFSKNFTQNILGNNSTLYDAETKILQPYAKASMQSKTYSSVDSLKDFLIAPRFSMFLQFEFNKLDMAFYRSLFKYLFIIRGRSTLGLKKRRGRILKLRKLLKRKWYKNYKQVENFRLFSGLSSFDQPIVGRSSLAQYFDKNNLFGNNFDVQSLRFISSQFISTERHSRLESRFLKIFWLTFPIYFSMTRNFLFNMFPTYFSLQFFPSKLKILSNNLINKIVKSNRNLQVSEFFDRRAISNTVKEVTEASTSEGVPIQLKGIIMSEAIPEDSVIKFFEKNINSQNQRNKQGLSEVREQFVPKLGEGVLNSFDVLTVNRAGILDDLRRINSTASDDEEEKKETLNEESFEKDFEGEEFMKEKIQKFYRNRASRLNKRNKNRFDFVKKGRDLYALSGISEGFTRDQFSKKRIRYKRHLKRKGTNLRAFWITKNRFFFPNQYNNLFDISQKMEFIELYKILEYFYFVLLNDRDLYDMAEYSFIVSSLRDRFGISIVNDLLSNVDHKQASKVSVIMHAREFDNVVLDNNQVVDKDTTSGPAFSSENDLDNKSSQKNEFLLNYSSFIMQDSNAFLLRPLQEHIRQLVIYYNNIVLEKNKKTWNRVLQTNGSL